MERPSVRAWRPEVPGVAEVLHAHFPDHAYPSHVHDTWTLLVVDSGTVRFGLERAEHQTVRDHVMLLPPHVPHDGRTIADGGFHKRVLYLDAGALDLRFTGRAVDHPGWADPVLRRRVHLLHESLLHPGDRFESESRLALVSRRLSHHLARDHPTGPGRRDPSLASRLRALLDERLVGGVTLDEASRLLDADPVRLVRAFRREVGIAPHRYLTSRRLDAARRLLLAGGRPAEVAVEVGFYDQAHLGRHFKRLLGVGPAEYAAAVRAPSPRVRTERPASVAAPHRPRRPGSPARPG